jgi:hypothetical protein
MALSFSNYYEYLDSVHRFGKLLKPMTREEFEEYQHYLSNLKEQACGLHS